MAPVPRLPSGQWGVMLQSFRRGPRMPDLQVKGLQGNINEQLELGRLGSWIHHSTTHLFLAVASWQVLGG